MRLIATFKSEAQLKHHNVPIILGKRQFDATEPFLKRSLKEIQQFDPYGYDADNLYYGSSLYDEIDHNAPFSVDCEIAINAFLEANGIEDRATMTQDQLDNLRKKYNV